MVASRQKQRSAPAKQRHEQDVVPTREQFSAAAKQRHEAALQLLESAKSPKPQVAGYLNVVAMECLLKARILAQAEKSRVSELRPFLGDDTYKQLFRSSEGHRLGRLAEQAALRRLLAAAGLSSLLQKKAWSRMCKDERPYSLRYGTEKLHTEEAIEEVQVGSDLLAAIENAP
ncbi:MAG: hypothetical protein JNM40_14360 [Myxococcales bacterium]|nr:hypothetical protein [Myxococcales bacterium]